MNPMLGVSSPPPPTTAASRSPARTARRSRRDLACFGPAHGRRSPSTTSATASTRSRSRPTARQLRQRADQHADPPLHHHRVHRHHAPPHRALTRKPGSFVTNTVKLPIDLNPGALATDAFVARQRGAPTRTGRCRARPRSCSPIRRRGPSTCRSTRARARTWSRLGPRASPGRNGQFFSPWATPAAIRAFAPFDLKSFRWTDSRGPSYRFHATIMETSATGKVNIAIGRGTKGKYKSFGTAKIRKHAFSKRFRLSTRQVPDPLQVQGQRHGRRRARDPDVPDHAAVVLPGRDLPLLGDPLAPLAGRVRRAAPSAARRRRRAQWRTVIVIRMLSSSCSVQMNL